jgi:hypothetical protein
MQKREKILLFAVLALVGLMGLRYGYGWIEGQFDERNDRITSLESEISRKEMLVTKALRAKQRMIVYEARSLPADREAARSQYQNWLTGLVDKSGLAGGVTSQVPQTQRGIFDRHTFTMNASGNLSQVVKFLYDFFSANHLHQLKGLSLKPTEKGSRLDVSMTVEAVSVPTAKNVDKLSVESSDRLKLASAADYQKAIAGRNFFVAYTAPSAKPSVASEGPTPPFDAAKYTTVSGIVNEFGRPQVWLNNRTSGDILRLSEGSDFKVGAIRGTIARIDADAVEVQLDGRRMKLTLGQSLRDATPVRSN